MSLFKSAFLLFAFLLEIALLVAMGHWGFQQGKTSVSKYAFAIILVCMTIVIWGTWMAPTSRYRLEMNHRIIAETILFLIAAVMIYKTGHTLLALLFTILILLREILCYIFKW